MTAHAPRPPWTFAAVCVMVPALTLLVIGLSQVPVIQLLPGYAAAYLLIGVCIIGPVGKVPSLWQAVAFLLPGTLLVGAALLDLGFWAGGWLLGLPAWGLLLSRWTPENPLRVGQVLAFLGLLMLGMAIFTFNVIRVVFSLGLFLLPVIPLIRLAYPAYRARPRQAAMDSPGCGRRRSGRSATHAGRGLQLAVDPRRRGGRGRAHDRVRGHGPPPPLSAPQAQ